MCISPRIGTDARCPIQASGALGRLFNKGGPGGAGALPGGVDGDSPASDAEAPAAVDSASALAAARAAEAAMQEASRASTELLGKLEASRAAGDEIEPSVLAALEELPARVFDDDSYELSDAENSE